MQALGRTLAAVGATVLLGLAAGIASGSTSPPGAGYQWAQPPSWIPITAAVAQPSPPGMEYAWAQPGTAPVDAPYAQPPALVPTDASSCSIS
jgi:hypothetical protein